MKRIEEITIHNNKAIEEMERKKIQMKCMLTIWNKTGIQIVEPHRLLIKEGTLMYSRSLSASLCPNSPRNTHNPTSLQIWLFNDIIICGMMPITRKSSNHDVLSCKDTYFFGTPLHLCQITSHPSDLSYGNTTSLNMNDCTFLFESQCPKDSFLIITKYYPLPTSLSFFFS